MFIINALAYSGTNVIGQFARFGQEVFLRRVLGPEVLGIWSLVGISQGFAKTFDLGVLDASSRQLPILHASADAGEQEGCRSTALWTFVAQHVVLGGAVLAYGFWRYAGGDARLLAAMGTAAFTLVLLSVYEAFLTFHQCAQRFIPLSRALLACSILYCALLSAGAWAWGLGGLLAAAIVAWTLQAGILLRSSRRLDLAVGLSWSWDRTKQLLRFGLPLRVLDYPTALSAVLDSVFVGLFFGVEPLAIYATARSFFMHALEIPARMSHVMVMRLFHVDAAAGRSRSSQDLLRYLTAEYLVAIPLVICGTLLLLGFLIAHVMPRYAASLPVAQILLFQMYFLPQTSVLRNIWMLDKRFGELSLSGLVWLAAIGASLALAISADGMKVEAVARASLWAAAAYFLYLLATMGRELWGVAGAFRVLGIVALSFGYTHLVVHQAMGAAVSGGLPADALVLLLQGAKTLAALGPILLLGIWKSRVLPAIGFR